MEARISLVAGGNKSLPSDLDRRFVAPEREGGKRGVGTVKRCRAPPEGVESPFRHWIRTIGWAPVLGEARVETSRFWRLIRRVGPMAGGCEFLKGEARGGAYGSWWQGGPWAGDA